MSYQYNAARAEAVITELRNPTKPYCKLDRVARCQHCKLIGMEDLCGLRPALVSDMALTKPKPPVEHKNTKKDFWVKNAERGMLLSRDRSRYLGYYDPDSVITRIDDAAIAHITWDMKKGIPVYAWEYRAYREDPETPRRIYVGDDASIRESELDHYKDGGYAEDEDGEPQLVTPFDAGLDPEEDLVDPENTDMYHDGGFVPALMFRTTYEWHKVLRETDARCSHPYYALEKVPTLHPVACRVDLKDGYVVPCGKYVRLSTIKTKADRKRARARADERRFLVGFVGKERARELTGYIVPGRKTERQVVAPTC